MSHTKLINSILNYLLVGVVFLTPILFFPLTSDAVIFPKHIFFILAGAAILAVWTLGFVAKKRVSITVSPLLLPIFLLAAASAAALFLGQAAKPEGLIGQTGLLIAFLILFLAGSSRPQKLSQTLINSVVWAGAALGLFSLLGYLDILTNIGILGNPGKSFTPAGNLLTLIGYLAAGLPLAIGGLKRPTDSAAETTSAALKKLGLIIAGILILAGIALGTLNYFGYLGTPKSQRLSLNFGWKIAIETLKISPLLGVGPNGYLAAFTQYRPLEINSSDLWSVRFQQAPNELMQRFTENGLIGLAALILVAWSGFRLMKYLPKGFRYLTISLGLFGVWLLIEPLNVVSLSLGLGLLLAAVLSLKQKQVEAGANIYDVVLGLVAFKKGVVKIDVQQANPLGDSSAPAPRPAAAANTVILGWISFVPAILLAAAVFYLGFRAFGAELEYRRALQAIVQNDGTNAYNQLIKTITKNPWFDTYHRQYADVNLRLANSLAAQKNLTDQDRNNVTQLIQQAIREGKISVQLDPADVRNWEQLAVIYRALINVADGARDWTIITYTEAVRRDPVNPLLRLDLGGVFYSLNDWESAIRTFQTAASIKPDYANAYYNLALAYEQDGRFKEAARAMQTTVQVLDPKSPDYAAARQKLDELVKKAQEESGIRSQESAGTSQERLTEPQPIPTPLPGANRVELSPEEAAPPVTPTPTATPAL